MRTYVKWSLLSLAALLLAAIPTRLGSHDVAVGLPFTWHASRQIVTLGEQPHTFSLILLLCDFGIALLVLMVGDRLLRMKQT